MKRAAIAAIIVLFVSGTTAIAQYYDRDDAPYAQGYAGQTWRDQNNEARYPQYGWQGYDGYGYDYPSVPQYYQRDAARSYYYGNAAGPYYGPHYNDDEPGYSPNPKSGYSGPDVNPDVDW